MRTTDKMLKELLREKNRLEEQCAQLELQLKQAKQHTRIYAQRAERAEREMRIHEKYRGKAATDEESQTVGGGRK